MIFFFFFIIHFVFTTNVNLETSNQNIYTFEPNTSLEYLNQNLNINGTILFSCLQNCNISFNNTVLNLKAGANFGLNGFNLISQNCTINVVSSTFYLNDITINGDTFNLILFDQGFFYGSDIFVISFVDLLVTQKVGNSFIEIEFISFQNYSYKNTTTVFDISGNYFTAGITNLVIKSSKLSYFLQNVGSTVFINGILIESSSFVTSFADLTGGVVEISSATFNSTTSKILISHSATSQVVIRDSYFDQCQFCLTQGSDQLSVLKILIKNTIINNINCEFYLFDTSAALEAILNNVYYQQSTALMINIQNLESIFLIQNSTLQNLVNNFPIFSFLIAKLFIQNSFFIDMNAPLFSLKVDFTFMHNSVFRNISISNVTSLISISRDSENQNLQTLFASNLNFQNLIAMYQFSFESLLNSFSISFYFCLFENNFGPSIRMNTIALYPNQNFTLSSIIFRNNTSQSGSAIFSSTLSGLYFITNCLFEGNSAQGSGGALNLNTENIVIFTILNCNFTSNTASGGGAIFVVLGTINGTNLIFSNNSADYASDMDFSGYGTLYLSNTLFANSLVLAKASFIGRGDSLIFLQNITFLNSTSTSFTAGIFFLSNVNASVLNTRFVNLRANSNPAVYVSNTNLDLMKIFFNNTIIQNCTSLTGDSVFKVFSSYSLIKNTIAIGISQQFFSFFYAKVTVIDSQFTNSLISLQFSEVNITNASANTNVQVFSILSSNLSLHNSSFKSSSFIPLQINLFMVEQSNLFIGSTVMNAYTNCHIYSLYNNITIKNSKLVNPFSAITGYVSKFNIDKVNFTNLKTTGIQIQDFNSEKSIFNVTNSLFEIANILSANYFMIQNSDLYMVNITFSEIYFFINVIYLIHNNVNLIVSWEMDNITFEKSSDLGSEMIVLWDSDTAPKIQNFNATIGKRIISTPPLYLGLVSRLDPVLLPGIPSVNTLEIHLLDYYNQTLTNQEYKSGDINFYNNVSKNSFIQNKITELLKGVFYFSNVSISAEQNQRITLQISTSAIPSYSKLLLDLNLSSQHINQSSKYVFTIDVTIGNCSRGQVFAEALYTCTACPPGKYSLNPQTDTFCLNCPQNAICYGKDNVSIIPGFWKMPGQMMIIPCTKSGLCPGGSIDGLMCSPGYEGPLCSSCSRGYFRGIKNSCEICGEKELLFSFLISGSFLVIFVCYHSLMIKMKINSKRILTTVIIKVFIDHLQLSNLLSELNVPLSFDFFQFFRMSNSMNDPGFLMFGFDCILEKANFGSLTTIIKKLLFLGILTLVVPIIVAITWYVISLKKRYTLKRFKRFFILSLIILFYSFQPTYVSKFFEPIICYPIGDSSNTYMKSDLTVQCWTDNHILILIFSSPFLISWAFLIPVYLFIKLMRCEKEVEAKKRLEIPYYYMAKGYRLTYKYWDFIVMFQKIFAISIVAFAKDSYFASFFILGLFLGFLVIQIIVEPYASTLAYSLCLQSRIGFLCNIVVAIALKQNGVFPFYVPYMFLTIAGIANFSFFIAWFVCYLKIRFGIFKNVNILGLNEYRYIVDSIAMKFNMISKGKERKGSSSSFSARGTILLRNTEAKQKNPRNKKFMKIMMTKDPNLVKDVKLQKLVSLMNKKKSSYISNSPLDRKNRIHTKNSKNKTWIPQNATNINPEPFQSGKSNIQKKLSSIELISLKINELGNNFDTNFQDLSINRREDERLEEKQIQNQRFLLSPLKPPLIHNFTKDKLPVIEEHSWEELPSSNRQLNERNKLKVETSNPNADPFEDEDHKSN